MVRIYVFVTLTPLTFTSLQHEKFDMMLNPTCIQKRLGQDLLTSSPWHAPFSSFRLSSVSAFKCFQGPLLVDIPSSSQSLHVYTPSLSLNGLFTFDINFDTFKVNLMQVLPREFDGDILFELHLANVTPTMIVYMQGKDRKHDGHPWCAVKATPIKK
jgi:hypothetical protein